MTLGWSVSYQTVRANHWSMRHPLRDPRDQLVGNRTSPTLQHQHIFSWKQNKSKQNQKKTPCAENMQTTEKHLIVVILQHSSLFKHNKININSSIQQFDALMGFFWSFSKQPLFSCLSNARKKKINATQNKNRGYRWRYLLTTFKHTFFLFVYVCGQYCLICR